MTTVEKRERAGKMSAAARERMLSRRWEPLFLADWERVLMIHYEVDREELQRVTPFEVDEWEGRALVSVVAFTMRRMRPRTGGRLGELLLRPIGTHEFLNVRTYVRHGGESGIFFLAEWLSNTLSVALGPRVFGLPYRYGHISYEHEYGEGWLRGAVEDRTGAGEFRYYGCVCGRGEMEGGEKLLETVSRKRGRTATPLKWGVDDRVMGFRPCEAGSLEEWLMERYTAFTCVNGKTRRFFRVWHKAWLQVPVEVEVQMKDQSLLETSWSFFGKAQIVGGNFSPGLKDVWMGRPHRL